MGFLPVPTTPIYTEKQLTPNVKQYFSNLSKPWDHWSSCFPILWVFDLVLLDWGQTIFISNSFPGDIDTTFGYPGASLVAQRLKCLPAMRETWVWSLGQEDLLEKEMATHSSILAWRIPWTEELGGLQSMESQRAGHDWMTSPSLWVSSVESLWASATMTVIWIIEARQWSW